MPTLPTLCITGKFIRSSGTELQFICMTNTFTIFHTGIMRPFLHVLNVMIDYEFRVCTFIMIMPLYISYRTDNISSENWLVLENGYPRICAQKTRSRAQM